MSTPLVLKKSDATDWYTIERASHPNKMEIRPTKYGMALWYSGRISDADVEGTAAEMREIAKAIDERREESFTRCAVDARTERVRFWSPRNDYDDEVGFVTRDDADALAAQIWVELPAGETPLARNTPEGG